MAEQENPEFQRRLINFAISKLRECKDENEKIATLFLVLKVNLNTLIEENMFVPLFLAISPTFIYRLLKSAKSENPIIEEIELGLEILSLFISNAEIKKRKEIPSLLECVFASCSIDEIKCSSKHRLTVTSIINASLSNNSLKSSSYLKYVPSYLSFVEHLTHSDSQCVLNNCQLLIALSTDSKSLCDALKSVLLLVKEYEISLKLKIYDIILAFLVHLNKLSAKSLSRETLCQISSFISHFVSSSKPVTHKSTILLAHTLQLCTIDEYIDSVDCKRYCELSLNLCLIELELFLNKVLESNLVFDVSSEIEACLIVVEAFARCYSRDICFENLPNKLCTFKIFLTQVLYDLQQSPNVLIAAVCFFKLLCLLWSCPDDSSDVSVIMKFSTLINTLYKSDPSFGPSIVNWVLPFITYIYNQDRFQGNVLDPNLLHVFISMLRSSLKSPEVISDHSINSLLGFYYLISFDLLIEPCSECFNQLLTTIQNNIHLDPQIYVLVLLCSISLCIKLGDEKAAKLLHNLINLKKLKNILNYDYYSDLFIEDYLNFLRENRKLCFDSYGVDEVESIIVNSRPFVNLHPDSQAKINEMLERLH